MLTDYARYIENIRNGLIQCGVIFPQIDNIDTADYGTLFHIGEKISDIMYFYKIMVCSGNMDAMFIPMGKSYRGTIRSEAFLEFKEDILPLLKEQLGDEDPDSSFDIDTLCDLGVFTGADEEPEEWVNDDIPVEDTVIELNDLFGEDDEDEEVHVKDQFVSSGASLWGAGNTEWVSSGTNLFGNKPISLEQTPMEYVPCGTDLFSIRPKAVLKESKVVEPEVEYVSSGTELFSISVSSAISETWEDPQDVWVDEYNPDDSVFEDNSGFEDQGESPWEEDTEDVWVSDDSDEEGGIFSEDDQDSWVADDEDYEDTSGLTPASNTEVQDFWVDDDESEDIWVDDSSSSGGDAFDWEEEPVVALTPQTQKPLSVSNSRPVQPKPVNQDRDIVDSVQDAASAALTSAKRFLANITNPKK